MMIRCSLLIAVDGYCAICFTKWLEFLIWGYPLIVTGQNIRFYEMKKILSQLHSVCTSHILDIFFSSSVLFFFSISNTVWTLKYHTQHNYFNGIFSVHVSHTNIFYSFTVMHLTVYPLQMKNTHCNNDDNI